MSKRTIIIGAGPAGLAAAYELSKQGQDVLVLEKENYMGGMCRTVEYKGYRFDLGGHRFFTKSQEVQKFWQEVMGEDFMLRSRLSRMYYKKKFFAYPIKVGDALAKLGIRESFLVAISLVSIKIRNLFNKKSEVTFEDWIINRFGRRLFKHFFKSYTEKMWGISTKELGADWAAQRMKDVSLTKVLKSFLIKTKQGEVKSWIEKFDYPKLGPGQLYEKAAEVIKQTGGQIRLNINLEKIVHNNGRIEKIIVRNSQGETEDVVADNYISSIPLSVMLKILEPAPPKEIIQLVNKMRFRSFFDVCLIVNQPDIFPDNWIYVHEPEVKLLRMQNFKNWSPWMSADENKTPIGAEYVCWDTDELWHKSDRELIDLAKKESAQIGLIDANKVEEAMVIKNRYAYPVYHLDYEKDLKVIFDYLSKFKNLQTIGRSGLYRYNNMDHSVLTGFYAARNVMGGNFDILEVNVDKEYHEQ